MCVDWLKRFECLVVLVIAAASGCGSLKSVFPSLAGDKLSPMASLSSKATLPQPTPDNPVVFAAAINRPAVGLGESVVLQVRGEVLSPWYIYAMDSSPDVGPPTKIELFPPQGIRATSSWTGTQPKTKSTPLGEVSTLTGDLEFSINLMVESTAEADTAEIVCRIEFQACSDSICRAPTTIELPVTVRIK